MKYTITWLVLAVVVAIGIGSLNLPTFYRLAERGVSEKATVVELFPQNHNTVRYEYKVAGQVLQRRMGSSQPNPPSGQLAIGQSVVIYYDPQHPEVSVLGDPKLMMRSEMVPVVLAAIIFPTFLVVVLAWKDHERKKATSKSA